MAESISFEAEGDAGARLGKNKTIAEVSNGASAFELEKLQLRY